MNDENREDWRAGSSLEPKSHGSGTIIAIILFAALGWYALHNQAASAPASSNAVARHGSQR